MSQGALQPPLWPLTDQTLPFITAPQILREYLVCVISFLSLPDDCDMSSIFPLYVTVLLQQQKKRWTKNKIKIVQLICHC
jgi:hypothetical protein